MIHHDTTSILSYTLFYGRLIGSILISGVQTLYTNGSINEFIVTMCMRMAKEDVLCVKMLQAVASNQDVLDNDTYKVLTNYTDNVPYIEADIDYDVLEHVVTCTPFSLVSRKPWRSGMISLIFQLVHNDTGEKYVLKVKRNNIHNELKESITHIYSLMGIVSMVTTMWLNIDITSTVVRHIDLLDEQLDFELEKMNTATAYKNCALLDYIKIPKIYSSDTQLGPILNKYIIII